MYTDEGGEFKGAFKKFLEKQNIETHVFKKLEGPKRRLTIAERFNKMMCCFLEFQRKQEGDFYLWLI